MSTPQLTIRGGHPDFLDLPWDEPIDDWTGEQLVELPKGVHRHPVVFVAYADTIYALKELPRSIGRREFDILRALEPRSVPTVTPVGLAERPWLDPHAEGAAVVITQYEAFTFPYRQLVERGSFGSRRRQMINALADLLVELHLAGCFWGDCSLSNVLYRFDAAALRATMIDGETAEIHDQLTDGQRRHDLAIMIENLAGGMADIAATQGVPLDEADLGLGEAVAARYHELWSIVIRDEVIGPEERYRIRDRIREINELGFDVEDVDLQPVAGGGGGDRLRMRLAVGARNFHRARLRELAQVDATENQARQILSDLRYHEAKRRNRSAAGKAIGAIQWRVGVFEPLLERIRTTVEDGADPVQAYCDFLHHRYLMAASANRDVTNDEAYDSWLAAGMPGYTPD